ncbi:hypothetical protein EON68_01585 [archaeon]|nr:MAG: hypothetical protein EON68_01585 [archaeon]
MCTPGPAFSLLREHACLSAAVCRLLLLCYSCCLATAAALSPLLLPCYNCCLVTLAACPLLLLLTRNCCCWLCNC